MPLDDVTLETEKENSITDGTLDGLIRTGKITGPMATSVMNDYAYAENVVRLLADTGRILFGEMGIAERDAQELLRFDEEEREKLSEDFGDRKKTQEKEPV